MSTPKALSANTRQQYLKRAESLIQRFNKYHSSLSDSLDLQAFLEWQDAQKTTLSPATRRLYRAALACYFNHHNLYDLLTDRL
jgi:DnaJ-domain-containing protein 1